MPLQTEDTTRVWSKDRWQPAQLLPQDSQPKDPRSYKIRIPSGTILRRNRHALLKTCEGEIFRQEPPDFNVDDGQVEQVPVRQRQVAAGPPQILPVSPPKTPVPIRPTPPTPTPSSPPQIAQYPINQPPQVMTRTGRTSSKPRWLNDYVT